MSEQAQQAQGNGQIVKPRDALSTVARFIEKNRGALAEALPRHMSADRINRLVITELRNNPKLLECSPISLMSCVMQSALLGLEPGALLGHAFLIPRWSKRANGGRGGLECTFMPGYKGLQALARRSGEILDFYPRSVRKGDRFKVIEGTSPSLEHEPKVSDDDTERPITHVYSVAFLKNGRVSFQVMRIAEVEKVRDRVLDEKDRMSPWHTDFEAMSWKTVMRRHVKFLPSSADLRDLAVAAELDAQAEAGIPQTLDVDFTQFEDPEPAKPAAAAAAEKGAEFP